MTIKDVFVDHYLHQIVFPLNETLWGCCGVSVEGTGDMGPHTTDTKRLRFRADSTIHDDKLVSCTVTGCHSRECKWSAPVSSCELSASIRKKDKDKARHYVVIYSSQSTALKDDGICMTVVDIDGGMRDGDCHRTSGSLLTPNLSSLMTCKFFCDIEAFSHLKQRVVASESPIAGLETDIEKCWVWFVNLAVECMTMSLLGSTIQNHLTTHLHLLRFSCTNLLSVPTVVASFLRVHVILFTGRLLSSP
ncbi:hypothetical protein EV702DRAFT_1048989 [Suillus placidus]|uniref:Uncharacterized protein n=1 Tax=Suillus placidus TaxID=48579 RepID=A0A9P7CZD2_9AGAM|nr:hypothetical protein EV702DRAFT_1048989 [Suillus placidus]